MPKLVRLYIVSVAIGFAISAIFVTGLVALDLGGLRDLVLGSSSGWLAGVMLFVFNGIVFAGVQFGYAVMSMAERDDPPSGGRPARLTHLVPALARAPRRRNTTPRQ